ncbi:IS200/IS605 family element transposase accessory protein TnpB [Scytonema sp. UIC 10036]|uniref:IS200/IS605 family accessory protein TnpB-related protein n=1 Tax=Scytonema sp. UIC 10036 TaxID=2304196 RepID=UPI0012DA0C6E|nr:IS200/IS605 family element transposase accessory protein TnpB [Scytonema sp. UIC 10036]MUH00448.1 IS200/IS605 family element transposase accessory protein TnpB [Scytonema sp. UIC 10036]
MAKKKSLYAELTHRSYSRQKDDSGNRIPQLRRGIEAQLPFHPFLEDWGFYYQSFFHSAVNQLQKGQTEDQIEKEFQKRFGIEWAWADSLATDAKSTYDQLVTARENRILELSKDIESGWKAVSEGIEDLENRLKNPTRQNFQGFEKKLLGLESKTSRLIRKQGDLDRLLSQKRLHICFGGVKLFNSQHHLEANNYKSHDEWKSDWEKYRSGNFYSIGKGRTPGNNRVAGIFYQGDDNFTVRFAVPGFLREDYGQYVYLTFEVTGQRKHDLLYALESNKPVTVQCFRREHKSDQWYIHLTTYVQDVPRISSLQNGCIGIDLNAETIDIIYVKRDGNPARTSGKQIILSFPIPTGTTGQNQAALRDIVCEIVKLASIYQCPIACENLDFSLKKAQLRHSGSKHYNRMLSSFIYDKFRSFLVVRAEKSGIEVKFVSPYMTSVIGMVKYMAKYGLNSASAAAMVIARRALGFKEYIPHLWLKTLSPFFEPEDSKDGGFGGGWGKISYWLKIYSIRRPRLFQPDTVLRFLLDSLTVASPKKPRRRRGKVTAISTSVETA